MKKMFALLSLCVLGCSTSGKTDPSGQPSGFAGLLARALPSSAAAQPAPTEQPAPVQQPAQPGLMPAPPSPMQPAQPPPMQPAEPDEPVGFEQPAASGNAEVCSAMCDRVAACQIASKEQCMPVCEPQVPQLTPEQRAQVIAMMSSMACEDMAQFGAQGASAAPTAPATEEGDGDGQDS